jgi:outer membrane lipoprotein-sorting protein
MGKNYLSTRAQGPVTLLVVRFLRTGSTRRLLAAFGAAIAVAAGGTAIALAGGSGPTPPAKPLANAVHDGLAAPQVQGITARVTFTNHLVDSAGIQGSNPLLSGATGRLWLSPGNGLRLELQSDNGDAQIVANKDHVFVYDGTSNTVYQGKVPQGRGAAKHERADHGGIPSVARIQRGLNQARKHQLAISGPVPGNIAGQPAYTVRVGPGRPGGLLGAVELAWDAAHGLPLRVAVYARGNNTPVLELVANDISYGPVDASTFSISPPPDAHVVNLSQPGGKGGKTGKRGKRHAASRLPFQLSAPATLAGRKRSGVKQHGGVAIVRYGTDLDGLLVIEKAAKPGAAAKPAPGEHRHGRIELPTVSVNGATAKVIDTPLGSVVTFERGGISYTVLGSVPAAVTETAARGL